MNDPRTPPPTDPNQHAPGMSRTLEENATRFRETSAEERVEPKLKPLVEPGQSDAERGPRDDSKSS